MLTPSFVSCIEPPLETHEVFTSNDLAREIQACASEEYTGQLDLVIKATKAQQWSLYFYQGGLVWGTSDLHPIRRWCRQLSLHCPQLVVDSVPKCWDYKSLTELVRRGQVQQGQMAAVLEGNITEILFDIHQRWERIRYRSELHLRYRPIPQNILDLIDSRLGSIPIDQAWQKAMQAWIDWQQAALIDHSPNLAPIVWKAEELRWQTSPLVYHNLITLADGNQTLRDLAVKLKQNLLPLTQSIMPYIRKGLIGLIEIGDINYSVKPVTATNSQPTHVAQRVTPFPAEATSPLIVSIDDSPIDSLAMGHILTHAGYRFINIQDPVKALPILLEHKPSLIFLDLIMPVINGYEICGQIRRVSAFKDIPVIILTSNDGIVDRVRAKMVGSSGFLAKPIDSEKVLATLHRYLPASTTAQAQKLPTTRAWVPNQQL